MFRQDRNCFGRGLRIYAKENIASKQLNLHLDKETEAMCLNMLRATFSAKNVRTENVCT